jgi:hypothetical protein
MSLKDEAIREFELRLGGGMVDVELDLDHYELALTRALRKYRQRASNSVMESFIPLKINAEQQIYQVPENVAHIREVIKRYQGSLSSGAGVEFEPFNAVYLSNMLLQNNSGVTNLLNYEMFAHRRELIARMFGAYVTFTWDKVNKTIFLHRKFNAEDEVFLWVDLQRSDEELLLDTYAGSWIKDYAFAHCKFMLGEARAKFSTIAGPQGGTSLNGDNLKSEAQAELEKLDEDLKTYVDGSTPLGFIIG